MKKNNNQNARPGLYEKVYEREARARVSEAEAQAQRLEAYERTAANRRNRGIARALLAFVIVVAIFCALTYTVYRLLFVISDIEVTGSARYTPDELITAAGVAEGDKLYSFSSRIAEERIRAACPYIKSLKVERTIPDKITFTVEEHAPIFFADIYGETFILSDDLTVLGEGSDTDGLCRLRLPAVTSAIAGTKIEFESQNQATHISETCSAVAASELAGRIGVIDLTDPFKLNMECDRKYLLVFGTYDECDLRLRVAAAVLKDEMFENENKAKLDLTNTSETTVTIDNTLVFE